MKNILTLILICILNIQEGFTQEVKTELQKFILKELNEGNYTFQLMKNKVIQTCLEEQLLVDENGKILYPKIDLKAIENETTIEFYSSGSIKLAMKYTDSLLTISPIENSFCPLIKIDLQSLTAFINDDKLSMVNEVSIKNKENAFKSAWDGFQWHSKLQNNSTLINPRLTIGKLKENGALYIEILWNERGNKIHYRLMT
ncbi:hypothetical protein [Mariniflexile maritimum]|uniref:hypothetical protein n=1 Tax=Mariniflexile maritimum TaxID=2682493 RepID=UPI0012F64DFE|nr:hypothetical protein [Mariniflexile maritimum]